MQLPRAFAPMASVCLLLAACQAPEPSKSPGGDERGGEGGGEQGGGEQGGEQGDERGGEQGDEQGGEQGGGDGARPCPAEFEPVCGCDFETYRNRCEAERAEVCVEAEGRCPVGAACGADADCAQGEYCEVAPGSCEVAPAPGSGAGRCTPVPEVCSELQAPVCGCDGTTFTNRCRARQELERVLSLRACEELTDDACREAVECAIEEYCERAPGEAQGRCLTRPASCPKVLDPVCGCDGEEYDNACFAAMAGVCVLSPGACPAGEGPGGDCETDDDCGEGEFCECEARQGTACGQGGSCAAIPEICADVWDPVCGCDGQTYGNDCERRAVAICLDHEGACEEEDACDTSDDCEVWEFCECSEGAAGQCGEAGSCQHRPEACTLVFDPVCGCDGQTYGNDCERQAYGVCLQAEGACPDAGADDACVSDDDCDAGEFCECAGDACGVGGACVAMPEICPAVFDPVCGCDGQTYGNDCERRRAGVCEEHEGACVDDGGDDACDTGDDCDVGEFCECGDAAAGQCGEPGACTPMPDICPLVFDPVCGCDGRTYANDCVRRGAGMCKEAEGACPEPEPDDDCDTDDDCDGGEFCECAGDACGAGGACVAVPEICPAVFDPVCGCDGVTYGNDCDRRRAAVCREHEGACVDDGGGEACDTDDDCDARQFCECADGAAGQCGQPGSCVEIPDACILVFEPVCGCDGETYSNNCFRIAAGVCLEAEGVCPDDGGDGGDGGQAGDGCRDDEDCGEGLFCECAAQDACGLRGEEGECVDVPDLCPRVFSPVCGCDGETYDNDCLRRQAQVCKKGDRACPEGDPDPVECERNADCEAGQLCEGRRPGQCGGERGQCRDRPRECGEEDLPVCGCDDVTYANDCLRARAGVRHAHAGRCDGRPPPR